MMGFILVMHSLSCLFLMAVILMQAGRGGGLTEAFASAEAMFGARTNEFMVKATAVIATIFLTTSLALAYLTTQRKESLIPEQKVVVDQESEKQAPAANAVSTPEAVTDVPANATSQP